MATPQVDFELDGLYYADAMPLAFATLAQPVDAEAAARMNADNAQVLIADASLDETHRSSFEPTSDEDLPLAADVQRIEFKLNVLLQLVGRLLIRDRVLPVPLRVRLHANGLEFQPVDTRPPSGTCGVVSLFINRGFPQPLELPGRIAAYRSDGDGLWAQFAFEGLSAHVTDMLEKLIFRHHRRQVAEARGGT